MANKRICSIDGCDKPVKSRGWCHMHYMRWHSHGDTSLGAFKARGSCSAEGCNRPHFAKGYCSAHYGRLRLYGDPLAGKKAGRGSLRAFAERAALECVGDDCLIWPYSKVKGYGSLTVGRQRVYAHRYVCELAHGIPPTKKHEAAHNCGNCLCVNPHHLRWATHIENEADKILHGTTIRGERSGNAKLNARQVLEIRALKGSRSEQQIADLYGVGRVTVHRIHHRQRWSHL